MKQAFLLSDVRTGVAFEIAKTGTVLSSPSLKFTRRDDKIDGELKFTFEPDGFVDYEGDEPTRFQAIVLLAEQIIKTADTFRIYNSAEEPRISFDFGIIAKKGEFGLESVDQSVPE